MTELTKSISALSTQSLARPRSTAGQLGMIKIINECVDTNRAMDWDLIVLMYCKYVRKTYRDNYCRRLNTENGSNYKWEFDILEEYQNQTGTWTYTIRVMVRTWFIQNIGSLVMKNQLIIVPVIAIE